MSNRISHTANQSAPTSWKSGCYGGSLGFAYDPGCPPIVPVFEILEEGLVRVFPNPSSGNFWIDAPIFEQGFDCRLLDVSGRVVFAGKSPGEIFEVLAEGLSVGIFWLEIVGNQGVALKKVALF